MRIKIGNRWYSLEGTNEQVQLFIYGTVFLGRTPLDAADICGVQLLLEEYV